MADNPINYEAWARNAVMFIREVGLEAAFKDWSGGFPCPIQTKPRRIREGDRFYGDPVMRFRAMQSGSTGDIDGTHFRMWCGIAADEIEHARSSKAGA